MLPAAAAAWQHGSRASGAGPAAIFSLRRPMMADREFGDRSLMRRLDLEMVIAFLSPARYGTSHPPRVWV